MADRITELEKKVENLEVQITRLEKQIGKLGDSTSKMNSELKYTDNIFSDIFTQTRKIGDNLIEFSRSLKMQMELSESVADVYKETGANIGINIKRSQEFGIEFTKAASLARRMGIEFNELSRYYTNFAEQTGRARILNPEEIERMTALVVGFQITDTSAANMAESFDLMGLSLEKSGEYLNTIINESKSMGLNTSKVMQVLGDNMKTMQNYSFRDGVRGMTKMAQLAVKMRMDVSEMLGMADKFYEPEAAIEAAANLQMLGGDIAAAFGDPFETMYLARNKPEELAERVSKMTENMMTFNEETQQYEFPPEARMQLKAAGEQLGVNVDNMIEIARQSAKIKDIKMNVSGNILDENMREGIASMARMGSGGNWVVDFKGEEIDVSNIGPEMAEALLLEDSKKPKNTDDAIMQTALNTLTISENMKSIEESAKLGVISKPGTNIYQQMENAIVDPLNTFSNRVEGLTDKIGDSLSGDVLKDLVEVMKSRTVGVGVDASDKINEMFDNLESVLDLDHLDESIEDMTGKLDDLVRAVREQTSVITGEQDSMLTLDPTAIAELTAAVQSGNQNNPSSNNIVMNFYGVTDDKVAFKNMMMEVMNEVSGGVPS
jgi:hypothetical protein